MGLYNYSLNNNKKGPTGKQFFEEFSINDEDLGNIYGQEEF